MSSISAITKTTFPTQHYFGKRIQMPISEYQGNKNLFDKTYAELVKALSESGVKFEMPSVLYEKWDTQNNEVVCYIAYIVDQLVEIEGYKSITVEETQALHGRLSGGMDKLMDLHTEIMSEGQKLGLDVFSKYTVEQYTSMDMSKDPSSWQTDVYYLIKA
ncbi:MAG: GyrI-like domain-containing protein [Patescibacteria group bacterium]